MGKQEENESFQSAVENLLNTVDRIANEIMDRTLRGHNKAAIKTVLIDYLQGMLSDNYHDDPNWYAEIVEDTLGDNQEGKEEG
jgi:hypothetical protein